MIAKTIDDAPRKPAAPTKTVCRHEPANGFNNKLTAIGRATNVKNTMMDNAGTMTEGSWDGNASLVGMMIGTPMAFVLFGGIPYGWNLVSKVTRYFEWILFLPIMGWLIYFGVKLMASMCCGWFFFGRECLVRIKVKGGRG